jgi:dTDP-4-dehydrorhamnose reductase
LKKTVLILGSSGLTGHQVYNYLKNHSDFNLLNISSRKKLNDQTTLLDARDELKFFDYIKKVKPHFIINFIGVLISHSSNDPESAVFLNAYFPHRVARLADEISAKLIHISTDCVFSGKKNTPYVETDLKDGHDVYAKTKSLGEVLDSSHLTIRTSVVGPEIYHTGEGLFDWFMHQSGVIDGWTKTIWSGVSTFELAKSVKWFIENNTTGLYHLTNGQSISKYELVMLFKKFTNKKIDIIKVDGVISDKSFIDTRQELEYKIPDYEEMIRKMVELMNLDKKLYKNYFF